MEACNTPQLLHGSGMVGWESTLPVMAAGAAGLVLSCFEAVIIILNHHTSIVIESGRPHVSIYGVSMLYFIV